MLKQTSKLKGGLPSTTHSYKDRRVLEYLARIAIVHKIGSTKFFECIVDAWNHKKSECKQLVIKRRKKTNNSATFLFTYAQKVIAQFPISTSILQGNNQLESYIRTMLLRKASSVNSYKDKDRRIKDLKVGMKHVNLRAKVLDIPKPKMVYTRYGNIAYVSNALIADETGAIRMSLWNQHINTISKGDEIDIKNGRVAGFEGERQLRIGRYGSLGVIG